MPIVPAPKKEVAIPAPKQGSGNAVLDVRPRARIRPVVEAPAPMEGTPDGTLMVRMSAYGREEFREVKVPVPRFDGPVAKVRVSGGVTKRIGEFEFARLDVAIELPCQPNETDLKNTYAYTSDKVDEFLRYELGVPPMEEERD